MNMIHSSNSPCSHAEIPELIARLESLESHKAAKIAFIASVSHQIRTLMSSIVGMTELITTTDNRDDIHHYSNAIQMSSEYMMSLLNNLLELSQLEAGNYNQEQVPFNLEVTLWEILQGLQLGAAVKNLELGYYFSEGTITQRNGAQHWIKQIVSHLLTLLIHLSENGEILIEVPEENQISPSDSESLTLALQVEAKRINIPQLQDMAGPLMHLDSTLLQQMGVECLNLAITVELIKAIGGQLLIAPLENHRVSLSLTIPCDVSYADGSVLSKRYTTLDKTIVLVTPNTLLRQRLKLSLEQVGFTVVMRSTLHGLQTLGMHSEKRPPDWLLIDEALLLDMVPLDNRLLPQESERPYRVALISSDCHHHLPQEDWLILQPDTTISCPIQLSHLYELFSWAPDPAKVAPKLPKRPRCLLRILLVEDNPVNGLLIMRGLSQQGYTVHLVRCGQDALTYIEKEPVDLVIMDVHLPGMDGLETSRQIRQLEMTTGDYVPILCLTASSKPELQQQVTQAGMNCLLTKPVSLQALQSAIVQLTEGHS